MDINLLEYKKLEQGLKALFILNGTNFSQVIEKCNSIYGTNYKQSHLLTKLKKGTLRFFELKNLLNAIDYDVQIINKNTNQVFKYER